MPDRMFVGLLLTRSVDDTELATTFRPKAVKAMMDSGIYPLEIPMPCGEKLVINDENQLPLKSIKCPCGDLNHWLVKVNRTPRAVNAAINLQMPKVL